MFPFPIFQLFRAIRAPNLCVHGKHSNSLLTILTVGLNMTCLEIASISHDHHGHSHHSRKSSTWSLCWVTPLVHHLRIFALHSHRLSKCVYCCSFEGYLDLHLARNICICIYIYQKFHMEKMAELNIAAAVGAQKYRFNSASMDIVDTLFSLAETEVTKCVLGFI